MKNTAPALLEAPSFFSAQIAYARRFYLDLNPPSSHPLAVVSGGAEHCRADYHVKRPGFQYHSVEFVAAGQGLLILAGKEHRLSAGDVFTYGPGVRHEIQSDAKHPLVKYFVDFTGRRASQLLKGSGPKIGWLVQTSNPPDIRRLYEELISAGLRSTPYRQSICSVVLEHLILRISETAVAPGTVGTVAFETYQRCHQFITSNYLQFTGLTEIAESCQLDAAYLCRLFRRFDHESPYQYLTRLKMIHAAERLQVPGVLVKQVADQLGFGDAFQFSRSFKKVLGVSPKKFVAMRGMQ
jgi:AraC-like DNA-binding protein/quercetin dioxygenase-like cupin family protein